MKPSLPVTRTRASLRSFMPDPNRAIISAFVTGWRYSTTPLRATNRYANGPEIGISEAAVAGRRAGLSRRFPRQPGLVAHGALQTSRACLLRTDGLADLPP